VLAGVENPKAVSSFEVELVGLFPPPPPPQETIVKLRINMSANRERERVFIRPGHSSSAIE